MGLGFRGLGFRVVFSCGAGGREGVGRTGSLLDTILHFLIVKPEQGLKHDHFAYGPLEVSVRGFRVRGVGFRVLDFRVEGFGIGGCWGLCRVSGLECRAG